MDKLHNRESRQYVIELEHASIAVLEFGPKEGTPILALHGWLDNAESFALIGERLTQHRLIAIDMVGHGLSSHRHPAMPYHIWDNVTDLHNLITTLGCEQVHLVGHSMGAGIVMLYASAFSDKVGQLMAIDGLIPLHRPANEASEQLAQGVMKNSRSRQRPTTVYAEQEDAIQARMGGRWPVPYEAAKRLVSRGIKSENEGFVWRHDSRLFLPSLLRFCPEQIRGYLNSVKCPCIVVKAQAGVAELIDPWIDELSNSTLIEISGGHHAHMETEGAAIIADIIETWGA